VITNSIQSDEDNESADMDVPKMQELLDDYNVMFIISLEIGEINRYNQKERGFTNSSTTTTSNTWL